MELSVSWIGPSKAPLDLNGPVDVAYPKNVVRLLEREDGIAAIEAAARAYPDKPAIVDNDLTLSCADVLDRTYGLAAKLIERFPAGSVLVSLVKNSAASPMIVLAGSIAGIVLVPIDASHPPDRQGAIFGQSGAVALILSRADRGVDDTFIPPELPRIMVDAAAATCARRPAKRYDIKAPQMVAFTSGSTGRPKGFVASGAYGNALLAHFIARFHLNDRDTILSLASLSTGGARDAFIALAVGATLRICEIERGFGEILRIMSSAHVTVLSFVPSALRVLIELEGAGHAFQNLRVLDLHGERILASDIALFRRKLPPSCHINVTMGSVEAGAIFSWFVDDAMIDGATVPIGYVLPGRQVALLGESGASVERGEVGELMVRGLMSLGAWHEGRLAPGPFLADPEDPMSRIYAMGDLVRERPDGLFEFVDRKGRQVKIHGLWADLGEVEMALRTIPGVADAAVIAVSRPGQREGLAAFVVMHGDTPPPPRGVLARIVAAETAAHMVPSDYMALPKIPRLANFKPDLVRLEAMLPAHPAELSGG